MPSNSNVFTSRRLKKRESFARMRSVEPREIKVIEEPDNLLKACAESNITMVRKIVANKEAPPNYIGRDYMERTPLLLAVENEDIEIITLLMPEYGVKNEKYIMEALLYSLEDENTSVALKIINHKIFNEIKESHKKDSPTFGLTALILAAQNEMYEVVNKLQGLGYTIEGPHDLNCSCVNCYYSRREDPFGFDQERLNIYRGLASISYISLFHREDPILRAIELRQEILATGNEITYFKAEYELLANYLSMFLANLLDKVRDTEELHIILSESSDKSNKESLARVILALKSEEKNFIAHRNCQMLLQRAFFKGFRSLQKASILKRIILLIIFLISYPPMACAYIFAPKWKKLRIIEAPISKFISHTFFFLLMLVFVVGSTINVYAATEKKFQVPPGFNTTGFFKLVNDTTDMYYVRSPNMNITQIAILVWVVGLVWQEIKQIYVFGWCEHMSSFLNWLDLAMLLTYVISYALRIFTLFRVRSAVSYYQSDPYNFILLNDNDTTAEDHHYWINADRFYWKQFDFLVLAELLFSVANVLSFTRILPILPYWEIVGGLQISFVLMIRDILRFMGLFLMVFLAFGVGLANIYWFYDEFTRTSVALAEHGKSKAELHYAGVLDSLKSCFWSIFGMLDPGSPDLNGYTGKNTSTIQIVGFFVYGAFMIAAIILLFNLLIAMMTSTYERMSADISVEWKFAHAQLLFEYIQPGFTLPVPLNVIPTLKSVRYMLLYIFSRRWVCWCQWVCQAPIICCRWLFRILVQGTAKTKKVSCQGLFVINHEEKDYKMVIGRVMSRFIKDGYLRKANMHADLENLREDVLRLRQQVTKALEKKSQEVLGTECEITRNEGRRTCDD